MLDSGSRGQLSEEPGRGEGQILELPLQQPQVSCTSTPEQTYKDAFSWSFIHSTTHSTSVEIMLV